MTRLLTERYVKINSSHLGNKLTVFRIYGQILIFLPFLMNNLPVILILVLTFIQSGFGYAQTIEHDLKKEWSVYQEGKFIPYRDHKDATDVVYFRLGSSRYGGDYLVVNGVTPVNLFVNNKLAATGDYLMLNIDSLSRAFYSDDIQVAIHQDRLSEKTLNTYLVSVRADASGMANDLRPAFFFRDFVILVGLFLIAMVAIIIRLNPKLAGDYFSIPKIISLREDESQVLTRIGNSTNILFYIYCSLLLGYFFMIVFRFLPDDYRVSAFFQAESFTDAMLQWVKLSAIILLVLLTKIILVLYLSYLFGITEVGGIHFFNWIRMIVVFFGVLTIVVFVYFISHGYDEYTHGTFLKLVVWLAGGWMVLIFLKLAGRANASMFHLFSYICATEVIPFLFIVKVLYN